MARKTLYPRLPDETALDKFLNQTLPRIQERRAAAERREEDIARADRIRKENLERDQQRYLQEQQEKQERFDLQREDAAFGYYSKGLEAIAEGQDTLGLSYLQRSNVLYTKNAGLNPYGTPDEIYDTAIEIRGHTDTFNSLAQSFYTSKTDEDMVNNFKAMSDYYTNNASKLNYNSTMGSVMRQINNQYKRYGAITNYIPEEDFSGFEKDNAAYSKYKGQTTYRFNQDMSAEWFQTVGKGTREATQEDLEKYFFETYKDTHSELARNYINNSLSAYEFDDLQWNQERWNNLGAATRRQMEVRFRDAMANAEFGHVSKATGRYNTLSAEQRAQVDQKLKKEYNFPLPSEMNYNVKSNNTSNKGSGNSVQTNGFSGEGAKSVAVSRDQRAEAITKALSDISLARPDSQGTIEVPIFDFANSQDGLVLGNTARVSKEIAEDLKKQYIEELKKLK